MSKVRDSKYIWLPMVLGLYFIAMTWFFGSDMLRSGKVTQFWITVGVEAIILVLLSIFLHKKMKLERKRDNL